MKMNNQSKKTKEIETKTKGISVKTTADGLEITLHGEKYRQLGLSIETGKKLEFYRYLRKFMKDLVQLVD
ncbi:MAG: hypothetical protein ACXAEU_18755 [Candidatus Hodarchaeales archaeon]|jgi:hypothetical protein